MKRIAFVILLLILVSHAPGRMEESSSSSYGVSSAVLAAGGEATSSASLCRVGHRPRPTPWAAAFGPDRVTLPGVLASGHEEPFIEWCDASQQGMKTCVG